MLIRSPQCAAAPAADIAKAGETVQQVSGLPLPVADAAFVAAFGGLCFAGEPGVPCSWQQLTHMLAREAGYCFISMLTWPWLLCMVGICVPWNNRSPQSGRNRTAAGCCACITLHKPASSRALLHSLAACPQRGQPLLTESTRRWWCW